MCVTLELLFVQRHTHVQRKGLDVRSEADTNTRDGSCDEVMLGFDSVGDGE